MPARYRPIMIRIPPELLDRAQALCPKMDRDPYVEPEFWGANGQFPRSTVIRIALERGLDVLEQEYAE